MDQTQCQQLSQVYQELTSVKHSLSTDYAQFLKDERRSQTDFNIKASEFNQTAEDWSKGFSDKALDLLSAWAPLGYAQRIHMQDGRAVLDAGINFSSDDFPHKYLPQLFRAIRGDLNLLPSMNHIDTLEEVGNLYFRTGMSIYESPPMVLDISFSAKRLKRLTDYSNGNIDLDLIGKQIELPELTSAGWISAQNSTGFNAPKLEAVITLIAGGDINVDALEQINTLSLLGNAKLRLTKVPIIENVFLYSIDQFKAENLFEVTDIIYIIDLPDDLTFHDCFPSLQTFPKEIKTASRKVAWTLQEFKEENNLDFDIVPLY